MPDRALSWHVPVEAGLQGYRTLPLVRKNCSPAELANTPLPRLQEACLLPKVRHLTEELSMMKYVLLHFSKVINYNYSYTQHFYG